MARQFRCSPKVIQNRIDRLAKKAMALTAPVLKEMDLQENLAADGLESFILSQFFPTNINVLTGSRSQFIYFFNAFYFHRKGRMTERQKEKAKDLYSKAKFEKKAPSKSFRELLDVVANLQDRSSRKCTYLDTDENQIYASQYRYHPGMQGIKHRTTNSKEERNTQNKLFSCNYIDRMIRKNQAEHVRETVQFPRNINHSMSRFTVYTFWSNFMAPHRVNRKKTHYRTHGEAAGISSRKIGRMVNRFFEQSRIFSFTVFEDLTQFQRSLWKKELINPLYSSVA